MKILISLDSIFLDRWLPACLAIDLPKGTLSMVGKLWVDGAEARGAGVSYRYLPFLNHSFARNKAMRSVIQQQIGSFLPNALVYFISESVMGRSTIEVAQKVRVPAVGLQTFSKRDSVLVYRSRLTGSGLISLTLALRYFWFVQTLMQVLKKYSSLVLVIAVRWPMSVEFMATKAGNCNPLLLYRDDDHLNLEGWQLLTKAIFVEIDSLRGNAK